MRSYDQTNPVAEHLDNGNLLIRQSFSISVSETITAIVVPLRVTSPTATHCVIVLDETQPLMGFGRYVLIDRGEINIDPRFIEPSGRLCPLGMAIACDHVKEHLAIFGGVDPYEHSTSALTV